MIFFLKKIIILLAIISAVVLIINKKEEYIVIPQEAIRIRVIANSNNDEDIKVKEIVKDNLNIEINKLLIDAKTINEARYIIEMNLSNIESIVLNVLKSLNYNKEFKINYGMNLFPEKEFKGIKYENGYYESLVITLGEGKGNNYWCVLYPPLCLLDNSKKDVEYRFFVQELIDKYL